MELRTVLCLLALASTTNALAAEAPAPDDAGAAYVQPHQMIDVGGRRLNLYCSGQGSPTVLFESGGSDWSSTWVLVHPAVAQTTRACVYDRAGLGYSDPSPIPRTPMAIAEDLHKLVQAAAFPKPVILVGHSLGGFTTKLYAALYPEDVAGLVLVDPAEERVGERVRRMSIKAFGEPTTARVELSDRTFLAFLAERYRRCMAMAEQGDLDPDSLSYKRCSDPVRPALGESIAAERRRLQVKSTYQQAQASEILNSVFFDVGSEPAYALLFKPKVLGHKPLVVLTHGRHDKSDPLEVASQAQSVALHKETAGLSSRGRHRIVADAGHNIQVDAPSAIIEAVAAVVEAVAAKAD